MSTRQITTPKTKRKVSAAPAKKSAKTSRAAATPAATPKARTRAGDPVRAKSPKRAGVAAKPKASPAMAGNGPAAAAAGDGKAHKPKLVRDSFTMPKAEYQVIDQLKQRSAALARPAKKSELLRAGLKALAAMDDAAFASAVHAVPAIKTGRPKLKKSPGPAAVE